MSKSYCFSSSHTELASTDAGSIKKGFHIVIDGMPCKVVSACFSKTGKHGHMKAVIVGIDVFTSKKYELSGPNTKKVYTFDVDKVEGLLVGIKGDVCEYLDDANKACSIQLDGESPMLKEMKDKIKHDKTVIIRIMRAPKQIRDGEFNIMECIESYKEDNKNINIDI